MNWFKNYLKKGRDRAFREQINKSKERNEEIFQAAEQDFGAKEIQFELEVYSGKSQSICRAAFNNKKMAEKKYLALSVAVNNFNMQVSTLHLTEGLAEIQMRTNSLNINDRIPTASLDVKYLEGEMLMLEDTMKDVNAFVDHVHKTNNNMTKGNSLELGNDVDSEEFLSEYNKLKIKKKEEEKTASHVASSSHSSSPIDSQKNKGSVEVEDVDGGEEEEKKSVVKPQKNAKNNRVVI